MKKKASRAAPQPTDVANIEIAIVDIYESYNDYDVERLLTSITTWRLVTQREFDALCKWCKHRQGSSSTSRHVIRRLTDEEVTTTIDQCLKAAIEWEEKQAIAAAERAAKAAETARKREEKRLLQESSKEEARKALYKQLQAEFGTDVPGIPVERKLIKPKKVKSK